MSSTPVLALHDFQKPFIIETDACQSAIGAVFMQDRRPSKQSHWSQEHGHANL